MTSRRRRIGSVLLFAAAFAAAGCQQVPAPPVAPTHEEIVARGEYLVTVVGAMTATPP